ncbi:MAG: pyrroline-5-carboxylate reductase [Alphaproteobacteria bacterium]|nr:pyrroline-5-carboxylate reductase [Alphaproteobacteria bacterium]
MPGPLLLVGCGKMGQALAQGWLAGGTAAADIVVVEPGKAARDAVSGLGVAIHTEVTLIDPAFQPRVVVLAVKPQIAEAVMPAYRRYAGGSTAFLSIIAGKPLSFFERHLGAGTAVVRAMPNTPAAIGRGMTVLCANRRAGKEDRALSGQLMAAVGEVAWVEDESLMDAVTAVSGSGPAYVFLLIECLAEAAVVAGLPAALAARLARQTIVGAAELARQSDAPPATLRENVTSPGGTTEAALKVLMDEDGLQRLMTRAVAGAAQRSRELAG